MLKYESIDLRRHQDAVLRLCRRVLRHEQDAEDACQEVLLEVSRQAAGIQEPGAFSAWLYRTALHTALDFRRKRGRKQLLESRVRVATPTAAPSDLNETLIEGIERLDEASRALLVEHYLAGRPLRELAADRGVSEVAVWKRLRNVRDRLKSSIGSVAFAALEESGWFWARLFTLKVAVAVPLGLAAIVGVVIVARPPEPAAPAPENNPAVAVAAKPRTTPALPAPAPAGSTTVAVIPAPASAPKPPAPRKPYPYKVETPAIPGGAQLTWTILRSTKVTLDQADATLEQFLGEITRQARLRFRVDAGLPKMDLSVKVEDIVVDGALLLMLTPSRLAYQIELDGDIRVGLATDVKGGFEQPARAAEKQQSELHYVAKLLEDGWDGLRDPEDRSPQIDAALARKIVLPQGETTLQKEIDRLMKDEGIHVILDGTPTDAKTPFLQAVEERTLRAHLEDLTRRSGLVLWPASEEMYLLAEPERIAQERAQQETERKAWEDKMGVLGQALPDGGLWTVQDFVGSVPAGLGIPVIPSEAAWNSTATFAVPPGSTLRQALDALKTQGFRWALYDGKLLLLK